MKCLYAPYPQQSCNPTSQDACLDCQCLFARMSLGAPSRISSKIIQKIASGIYIVIVAVPATAQSSTQPWDAVSVEPSTEIVADIQRDPHIDPHPNDGNIETTDDMQSLQSQISVAAEYDSNARRLPFDKNPLDDPPERQVRGDVLLRLQGAIQGDWRGDTWQGHADAAAGAKYFFNVHDASMLAAQSRTSFSWFDQTGSTTLGAFGKWRTQSSGARSYGLLRLDIARDTWINEQWAWSWGLSSTVFYPADVPLFLYSSFATDVGVRWQMSEQELLSAQMDVASRHYPQLLQYNFVPWRHDLPLGWSVSFQSNRSIFLSTSYTGSRNLSSFPGESYTRHRLFAVVGTRLAEDMRLSLQGSLQWTRYDDGLGLGQSLLLGDDDESQNNIQLVLAKPIVDQINLQAHLAWFGNELAVERLSMERTTFSVGINAVW